MKLIDPTFPPKEVELWRDEIGQVIMYKMGVRPEWTINRDGNGVITSVENALVRRVILRDAEGRVAGVQVETL